ncbi:DUF2938 family protein [Ralstonia solanacearum]|uniref:DUF2938 family protein n=1 Tax=Ralstonia solanacearum TaxID=305 RepID=UPI0001D9696E|nr:DUF2938 family protein [Ralstonia solanacearum]CBJ35905.1 conserved membrane protein of unknown function [Ralstonia solanacearum PSI07]
MGEAIIFCLIVGIGSTAMLDVWALLVERATSIPRTNWGIVGRWLLGVRKGRFVLDSTDSYASTVKERTVGWFFHYLIGIAYAAALIIFWKLDYIATPTILPAVIVGVVVSSLAGLMILLPGLGAGFFGSKLPNQFAIFVYVIVAHIIFAAGQYGFALLNKNLV